MEGSKFKVRNMLVAVCAALCFSATPVRANHRDGGSITYQWISGNTYKLMMSLYIECGGQPAPSTVTIAFESVGCGYSGNSVTLNQSAPCTIISPVCTPSLPQSSCNGGGISSRKEQKYEGIVTLPGNCNDWKFSYSACCRTDAAQNLVDPDFHEIYIPAFLNNLDVPNNNSVQFDATPNVKLFNNATNFVNWAAHDEDGDSLVYALTDALDNGGVPLQYMPGFSPQQPFISSQPTSVNPATGIISITPNTYQSEIMVMKISEYRNGILIGQVYRDLLLTAINASNTLPSLSGINGTGIYVTNGCPGFPITFNVYGFDPNAGQTQTMEMNPHGTGASLSSAPGTNPVGVFSWTPSASDISPTPHLFIMSIKDDYCVYYGSQNYAFLVYVNPCNTNDVWPGDANSSGIADLYDLLSIGQAFNDVGPARPSSSINWTAQPCTDWLNTFPGGINHKHADTDGNGVINFADTTALSQNFSLIHPRLQVTAPSSSSASSLMVTASADTVGLSTTVQFDIALSTPSDSIYGLAFRMFIDPILLTSNSLSISYPGSLFGTTGVDMVNIDRWSNTTGLAEVAVSRINQQNVFGNGPVARVTIVTTDNVSGKVGLMIAPFDILAITISGDTIPMTASGDEVIIDPAFVGLPDVSGNPGMQIYPNPASGAVFVELTDNNMHDMFILDADGRQVMHVRNNQRKTMLDVHGLPKGIYSLSIQAENGVSVKKLVIF